MERKITLGGKTYPILFRLKAIKIYQQLTGKNLLQEDLGKLLTTELDAEKITALVYAAMVCGCYPAKPEFTLDDVENWLGLETEVFSEVIQAYIDFIPGARENLNNPNHQPPRAEGVVPSSLPGSV